MHLTQVLTVPQRKHIYQLTGMLATSALFLNGDGAVVLAQTEAERFYPKLSNQASYSYRDSAASARYRGFSALVCK